MYCIIISLASLGLVGAASAAAYPIGWALGDLYEKRKTAKAAAAAAPATAGTQTLKVSVAA